MEDTRTVKISDLVLDPNNSRVHSEENIRAIQDSLSRFGQVLPLVVWEGVVKGGNGTLRAMQRLGFTEAKIVDFEGSEEEAIALGITLNRTAELASWDVTKLDTDLAALYDAGYSMESLGFSEPALDNLFSEVEAEYKHVEFDAEVRKDLEEDVIPEPPKNPITKLGDVWVLGRHRLVCGKAEDPDVVAAVLDGEKPYLMVTDPPYGVEYDASWRVPEGKKSSFSLGKVDNDDIADWRHVWSLMPSAVAYVWHADRHAAVVAQSLEACGFTIRSQIIWAKQQLVMSRGHYHWKHEPCWYGVRKGYTAEWIGDRKQTTLWEIANRSSFGGEKDDADTDHSTQKPLECMGRPLRNHAGDVIDPFLGSGTTLIAAEQLGRRCFGIELNPIYCDIIVERWENLTGSKAERINDD